MALDSGLVSKKIICVMVGMDKNSSTCSTFVGDASAYRMEADRKRLSAGIAPLPMHG